MRERDREDLRELLGDPRLDRILEVMLAAVKRTGDPPATIRIQSAEEADALRDLVGGRRITAKSIRAVELERRMAENSRFKCTLREWVEVRFGTVVSRREQRQQKESDWNDALARLQAVACRAAPGELCEKVFAWIETDRTPLRNRYVRQGFPGLARDLRAVIHALSILPESGRMILLAELAEQSAHDPHAFDRGQSAGSLLDRALIRMLGISPPGTAGGSRWRSRLLAEARIQRDSVSPRVDTFGLLLDDTAPPAPDPFALDRPWTLRSLLRVRGRVRAAHGVAFVFENPPVYESVLNRVAEETARPFDPTLICTNGTMNLADDLLLDDLAQAGTRIFYSGDFDGAGLRIALRLRDRHPRQVHLWHMEPADYRAALRPTGKRLRTARLARARSALPDLVAAMTAEGRVAYQEALAEPLFTDIARHLRLGGTPTGTMLRR